jgi:hypothetical protein
MWGLDIFFTHDLCAHILSHILQVWHQNVSLKEENPENPERKTQDIFSFGTYVSMIETENVNGMLYEIFHCSLSVCLVMVLAYRYR